MVFPVVMYGCQSWTIKRAEWWRTDTFELWCWRILMRVPWAAKRSHQSILKEISPEYSLEGLILKLKLQYFGHLMWRTDSLEKTLMLGKTEGRRRKGWQRMRWLDGIADSMDVSSSKLRSWWWTGRPGVLYFTGSQRVWHNWATDLNWFECFNILEFYLEIKLYSFSYTVTNLQLLVPVAIMFIAPPLKWCDLFFSIDFKYVSHFVTHFTYMCNISL